MNRYGKASSAFGGWFDIRRRLRGLPAVAAILLSVLASDGCSLKEAASRNGDDPAIVRLSAADTLVRAGCLDCLTEAYGEYDSLRTNRSVSMAATIGAIRTGALLAIRQREMGIPDSGYLARIRELDVPDPEVRRHLAVLLKIADTLPTRRAGAAAPGESRELLGMQAATRNRNAWVEYLRPHAGNDALSAYVWLALNCAHVPVSEHDLDRWRAAASTWQDTPLIMFKAGTCGPYPDAPVLSRLLEADPRFLEIHYFLGYAHAFAGRLDTAVAHRLRAYEWMAQWPSLTHTLGIDHMALEEFDTAVEFFQKALDTSPNDATATLDKAKALTYGGHFDKALEALDGLLLADHDVSGEARYWRAVIEWRLGLNDRAWTDVELAATMLQNSAVPKLAGLIAFRRGELKVSRDRFEIAWQRDRDDCETGFYLGAVTAELTWWTRTADVLRETIPCFERRDEALNREIAAIRTSSQPQVRRDRQISRREAELEKNERMVVVAAYNTAISYFNLARHDEALPFARRILDDGEFGERARALVAKMRPPAARAPG